MRARYLGLRGGQRGLGRDHHVRLRRGGLGVQLLRIGVQRAQLHPVLQRRLLRGQALHLDFELLLGVRHLARLLLPLQRRERRVVLRLQRVRLLERRRLLLVRRRLVAQQQRIALLLNRLRAGRRPRAGSQCEDEAAGGKTVEGRLDAGHKSSTR